MTPTIEDVLKKHGFYYEQKSYTVDSFALYDAAKAAMTEYASLNRQGWTRVEDGLPEVLGEDILICYEFGGQTRIELGYLCGENLIKGTTERYPSITHWMPLSNKPSI
jgi:hypothetical protein